MNLLFYLHVIIICRKFWYIILYLYVYLYTYSPTIALLSAQLEGHKDIRPTCFGHFGPNSLHMFAVSSAPTCWRSMAPDSVSLPLFPSVLTTGTSLFALETGCKHEPKFQLWKAHADKNEPPEEQHLLSPEALSADTPEPSPLEHKCPSSFCLPSGLDAVKVTAFSHLHQPCS